MIEISYLLHFSSSFCQNVSKRQIYSNPVFCKKTNPLILASEPLEPKSQKPERQRTAVLFLSASIYSNTIIKIYRYFVNDALLLSYPLEVVLNGSAQQVEKPQHKAVSSNDINDVVSKWIQQKLKECATQPRKSTKKDMGLISFQK